MFGTFFRGRRQPSAGFGGAKTVVFCVLTYKRNPSAGFGVGVSRGRGAKTVVFLRFFC